MRPAGVRSLGCRTDLMLIGWDGVVDEHEGAVRARSPSNPGFYYGNFLLFPDAPAPRDGADWTARFQRAFAGDPRIRHVCLRWDRPDGARGAADELAAAGFVIEEMIVLETAAPHAPPRVNHDVELRPIESDADWAAVIALQIATMTEEWPGDVEPFVRARMERYRHHAEAGRGAWLGAFAGPTLAADLGIFVEDGLARFQAVETAAAFRRRGLAGTLVHHAARHALDRLGARSLVIVGGPDHTSALYASVGFTPRERLVSAIRRPPHPSR